MKELVGTTKRPIYPLEAEYPNGIPYKYLAQLSENGLWIEIYDNHMGNELIGKLAVSAVRSMSRNYSAIEEGVKDEQQ